MKYSNVDMLNETKSHSTDADKNGASENGIPPSEDNISETDEFYNLILEIEKCAKSTKDSTSKLNEKLKTNEIPTAKGISLLEVKNVMMASYLSNIVFMIMKKCWGKSIEGDPAIERLVEIRTILERIQPIENKLKYQINKLIKIGATGIADSNDPKNFRANPNNLIESAQQTNNANEMDDSDFDSENEEDNTKEKKEKKDNNAGEKMGNNKTGIYVPPKLVAVPYDGDTSETAKKEKLLERSRKRALGSSVIQELHEEYLDNPIEVTETMSYKPKRSKMSTEKQEYEETYFTRLPASKKDKDSKSMMTSGNLRGLTHFEDISVLDGSSSFMNNSKRGKKLKGGSKNKKNKKGFKKNKRKKY